MIDQGVVDKLRERYDRVMPLMFQRSAERARSPGDLFDILDTIPERFPVLWCEESRRWVTTEDMYQSENFNANAKALKEEVED